MRWIIFCAVIYCTVASNAEGQESFQMPIRRAPDNSRTNSNGPNYLTRAPTQKMTDVSWILAPAPAPEEIRVHDVILVLVDERAEQQQRRQFQRQRQGTYNVALEDFIRLDPRGRLTNAAANEPTVGVSYERREQNRGNQRVSESLTYRIAASVTSIRPNGNLYIGARKSIVTNRDAWVYHMTGELNPKHIDAKGTIKSENIANLQIIKTSTGKVRDSAKRGWLTRILDFTSPF